MCQALTRAQGVLSGWLVEHPACFPPIVINITDGESTDGDPTGAAEGITLLASEDGNVLLFNLHISAQHATPIEFADRDVELPDQYAQLLFRMSSVLPAYMRSIAQQEGYQVGERARGFVFNGGIESVIGFLDIGTRPSNLR